MPFLIPVLKVSQPGTKKEFHLLKVVKRLLDKSRDSMSVTNNEGKTPYQCRLHFLESSYTKTSSQDGRPADGHKVSRSLDEIEKSRLSVERAVNEDEIAFTLKYYCLRYHDRAGAIKTLYNQGYGKSLF